MNEEKPIVSIDQNSGDTSSLEDTLMDDTIVTMDDPGATMGSGVLLARLVQASIRDKKPEVR